MARDYAARNRKPMPGPVGLPGWVWLVAGLSMGLVVAAIVYITRPTQPMPMVGGARSAGGAAGAVAKAPADPARPKVEIPPKDEPRFDFYTMLEKEQVVVSGEAPSKKPIGALPPDDVATKTPDAASASASVATPVTAPAASGQFLVVAGAFREQRNAEEHKARLALAGIESRIETVAGQDGGTWHRVRIGPEANLARAQTVVGKLKASGFDGRVVKLP